jgi:hypothetical protein
VVVVDLAVLSRICQTVAVALEAAEMDSGTQFLLLQAQMVLRILALVVVVDLETMLLLTLVDLVDLVS